MLWVAKPASHELVLPCMSTPSLAQLLHSERAPVPNFPVFLESLIQQLPLANISPLLEVSWAVVSSPGGCSGLFLPKSR